MRHIVFGTYIIITLGLAVVLMRLLGESVVPILFAQTPPSIQNVQVASTTGDSAVIRFTTSAQSIGTINYGKQRDYGIVRNPTLNTTTHEITLQDLDPSTTYYFRITATDQNGNQGISGDFSFITSGFENIENINRVSSPQQQALVGQAAQAISQVTDPAALAIIADEVENRAEDILRPPSIIGAARVREVGMDYAIIQWTTSRPAGSEVAYATAAQYANSQSYAATQGIPDVRETNHEVRLVGLLSGTTYHFQVRSVDDFGLEGVSVDTTFETKSRLPLIRDIQLLKIEEESVTIAWSTDIPAAGVIQYQNLDTGELRSVGSPEFLSTHTVRISDLTLGTTYVAEIRSENEQGDFVKSEQIVFTTIEDKAPPRISKVVNDSTLFPGSEARIQTIVTWETDEPSYCQMFFREGIQESVEPFAFERKTDPVVKHVQVVVEFQPATVYQFWIECTDRADNKGRTENFVLFTPVQEKNIIDIILENFEGAFGWVKNIGR